MSTPAIDRARAAWGESIPAWIETLAREADRTSQSKVAQALGYSASAVSQVLAAKYQGDLRAVEQAVLGAFAGLVVECPVLGEISRARCITEQRQPLRATQPGRPALWRACRGIGRPRCPHSRIEEENDAN
jgi:hypothetical protein